jgi:hypothetical protein
LRLRCGQKIKGRKRDSLTDPDGALLDAVVTQGNAQDREGAKPLLCMLRQSFLGMLMILSTCGIRGETSSHRAEHGRHIGHEVSIALGIVKKPFDQ